MSLNCWYTGIELYKDAITSWNRFTREHLVNRGSPLFKFIDHNKSKNVCHASEKVNTSLAQFHLGMKLEFKTMFHFLYCNQDFDENSFVNCVEYVIKLVLKKFNIKNNISNTREYWSRHSIIKSDVKIAVEVLQCIKFKDYSSLLNTHLQST